MYICVAASFRAVHDFARSFPGASRGCMAMGNLTTLEIKAFVPSKKIDPAKRFYAGLGFGASHRSEIIGPLGQEGRCGPLL
jgi:hypothetical protein